MERKKVVSLTVSLLLMLMLMLTTVAARIIFPDDSNKVQTKPGEDPIATQSQEKLPDPRQRFYFTTGGIPTYGLGEAYFHSYTHDFPVFWHEADQQITSQRLPRRFRFSGSKDVVSLLPKQ